MTGPSEAFAGQLTRLRQVRGWTTHELSDRLAELGMLVHPTAITKIEKGRRGISLDEAVAIAVAFNVPPVMLWLPFDVDDFDITPMTSVSPWLVFGWVRNETPLASRDIAAWRDWTHAAYELDTRHRAAQRDVHDAERALRRAEFEDNHDMKTTARRHYVEALETVADAWRATERQGFTPPRLPAQWYDDMRQLGMQPTPTWRETNGGTN